MKRRFFSMKRANEKTDREYLKKKITELSKESCCTYLSKHQGTECTKKVDFNEIMRLRDSFWKKNEEEQNQMILDEIENQQFIHSAAFRINDKSVCFTMWRFCYGIGKTRFSTLKKQYIKDGRRSGETKRKNAKGVSDNTICTLNWLRAFANDCGDHPPDNDPIARILPPCYTKKAVYQTYCESFDHPVSLVYFREIWQKFCNQITISQNNKFAKCGVCTLIKETRHNTRDAQLRKELSIKRELHNQQQMGERSKYYRHRDKAKASPNQYASLIIDGMDQNKTGLPHFLANSKGTETHFVKTHITGVISHGTNQSFQFIDLHDWKHDSNFTLSILLNALARIAKDGTLPPVLYIQFDNCWRENKNQYVLAFCALLVKLKLVKKVRLSYLLVGHTHEDIDSTFGHISKCLAKSAAPTFKGLENLVRLSYSPHPVVGRVKVVYNFKDWLSPNIRQLTNHTEPHAYKFEKNNKGDVGVWFKRFSMDDTWMELKPLLSHMPNGYPAIVRPTWEKQITTTEMKQKIASCRYLLKPTEYEIWGTFIKDLECDQKYKVYHTP